MISVIIPVFNAEKCIHRCLNSIIGHNQTEYELLLIDDGSQDQSLEICKEYEKEYPFMKVFHQENKGVSEARNLGIDHAVGEYIAFIDNDDYVCEGYLDHMLRTVRQYEDSVIISAVRKTDGINHAQDIAMKYGSQDISILDKADLLKVYDAYLFNEPVNKLYRTDIIHQNNIRFRKNLSIGEDMLFNMQYLMKLNFDRIIILNQNEYMYMQENTSSLSKRYVSDYYDIHKELMQILAELAKKCGTPAEDQKIWNWFMWRYLTISLQNTMREDNRMSAKEKRAYNNTIMKDSLFQDTLELVKNRLPKRDYIGYKTKSYRFFCLLTRRK